LHAAGVYTGTNRVCAADFVVSSYTPSLSALIKTRKDFSPIPRKELRATLVAEAAASKGDLLPHVEAEVSSIANIMESAEVAQDAITSPSVQTVLDRLSATHMLHLACHGIQRTNALESHFVLRDGPLSIASLVKLELPNAILAFLSACETAKGDQNQPDQAIHLAASMLFCGFRSVIGTMW
jgi:CHAT domain-containing protein